jgi:uncharacterized protein YrrD
VTVELHKLLNKPVYSISSGREMGTVYKLFFEPETHILYGYGLRAKQKKDPELLLRRLDVRAIGPDAITIASDDKVSFLDQDPRAGELEALGSTLKGLRVVTEDGSDLGKMGTIMLNEDGTVEAYHAKTGILGFGQGRDIQPESVITAGEDAIIVSSQAMQMPQQQRDSMAA